MFQRIRQERTEKAAAFGKKEKNKKQEVRLEALKAGRPAFKVKSNEFETAKPEDIADKNTAPQTRNAKHEENVTLQTKYLSSQKRKFKTPKIHLKKRA